MVNWSLLLHTYSDLRTQHGLWQVRANGHTTRTTGVRQPTCICGAWFIANVELLIYTVGQNRKTATVHIGVSVLPNSDHRYHHPHHFICPIIQEYVHLHQYNFKRAGRQGPTRTITAALKRVIKQLLGTYSITQVKYYKREN